MSIGKLTVMVVEDHGFQRRMAMRLLGELGLDQVLEAADGHQALEQLTGMAVVPEVLLVDLDMPGMDGIEFIGHVAEKKLARAVVVASALEPALLNTVQTMARAYGLRVLAAVEKPMTARKLADALSLFDAVVDAPVEDGVEEITAADILAGIDHDEFVPFFQPQVELTNGRVTGVEALARWRRPDGSVVRP
ncbi:MAG: response regulator, partial [Xanthomonadales bacterium]|nr:response regulator [Xanthomonadales bacterium]